jgi:tetratricopeptide (TPR) repeat protein
MQETNSETVEISQDIPQEIILANSLIQKDDLEGAKKILEDFIKNGNQQAFLYLALGDICISLNLSSEAKKNYEESIKIASLEDYKYNDPQVKVAAKAGLAKVFSEDAFNDFNALPRIEQIDELLELFPACCNGKKTFRNLHFLSSYCNCASDPSQSSLINGRWFTIPVPPYKVCKRVK